MSYFTGAKSCLGQLYHRSFSSGVRWVPGSAAALLFEGSEALGLTVSTSSAQFSLSLYQSQHLFSPWNVLGCFWCLGTALFTVCTSSNSYRSSCISAAPVGWSFLASCMFFLQGKSWSGVWLKENVWLQSRDQHQLFYISRSSCEWRKCYLSAMEQGRKKQVLELGSEANRPRLHPAGCAVSQHPWSSLSVRLQRLLTAVFWRRLLLPCKKEWLSGACIAFVIIQRLLLVFLLGAWYICSTDLVGISRATVSSSLWILRHKNPAKIEKCVFMFKVANSIHLPRMENTLDANCWFECGVSIFNAQKMSPVLPSFLPMRCRAMCSLAHLPGVHCVWFYQGESQGILLNADPELSKLIFSGFVKKLGCFLTA